MAAPFPFAPRAHFSEVFRYAHTQIYIPIYTYLSLFLARYYLYTHTHTVCRRQQHILYIHARVRVRARWLYQTGKSWRRCLPHARHSLSLAACARLPPTGAPPRAAAASTSRARERQRLSPAAHVYPVGARRRREESSRAVAYYYVCVRACARGGDDALCRWDRVYPIVARSISGCV